MILGGCGLPVGVQIASLVADGVSFLATDKTLTDHGISIVAEKDCALWRVIKGEDICREVPPETVQVADAAETDAGLEPAGVEPPASETVMPAAVVVPVETVELEALPAEPVVAEPVAAERALASADVTPEAVEPAPVVFAATHPTVVAHLNVKAVDASETPARKAGAYLVIASYYRSADAERFARSQPGLDTQVLAGTAKGHKVYRVAVGPVARGERATVKNWLLEAGYADVWGLRLREPDVVVQVASAE